MINPKASLIRRLTITKVLLIVTALIAAWVATFRLAIIVELVAWAFCLAGGLLLPGARHGHLVEARQQGRRGRRHGWRASA